MKFLLKSSLKTSMNAVLLSSVLGLSGISTSSAVFAQPQLIDRVVAVVDDQVILQSQLESQMREQIQQLRAQNIPAPTPNELAKRVLDSMILETVQLNRAKEIGLKVSDNDINQQLQKLAAQNNLTLMQLRERVNAQTPNGFNGLRQNIADQLTIQKLREAEVIARTQVTESEINNYLKRQSLSQTEIDLKHILISIPESATPAQRQTALETAESLRKRILAGEDFSQLAVRYSNGGKALQGGDLGWMKPSEVPTFFSDAANSLKVGETSKIIQSPSGFHLIQLAGKRDGSEQLITEFHLRQFIILDDNIDGKQPPKSLVKLTESIKTLADFDNLNQKFADIPEEVNRNSDLGWMPMAQIPAALRDAIAEMPSGHALGPIPNEQGWLIIFLEEKREQSLGDKEREQQAAQAVRMRKANEMFDIWLRRLKDEAYVRIQLTNS